MAFNPRLAPQHGDVVTRNGIRSYNARLGRPLAASAVKVPQHQAHRTPSQHPRTPNTQRRPQPAQQPLLGILRSLSHTQTVFSPYAKGGVALSLPDTWDNIYRSLDSAAPLVSQLRLPQLAALADVLSAAGYTNGAFYSAVFAAAAKQLRCLQHVYVQLQLRAAHPLRLTWHDRWRLRQRAKQQRLRKPASKDMLAPIKQQIAGAGRPLPLRLKPAPRPRQPRPPSSSQATLTPALLWLCLTRLTVACARVGLAPRPLLKLVSCRGAQLLQAAPPSFQQRRSLVTLARILAAFAALGWYPAPLAAGVGQVIKLQPRGLQRLPPWEVLLLLWAVARMRHPDHALLLQLQHRAAQQVGLFDCQQLSRAYALLGALEEEAAAAGHKAIIDWGAPEGAALLAALRKSTRLRLNSFAAPQLVQLVLGLAGLQQRDSLLLDELSRWLFNKAGNFTAADIVAVIASCARLGYLNPWLLGRLSRALVSPKRQLVPQLHTSELLQLLEACSRLQYADMALVEHVGQVVLAPGMVPTSLQASLHSQSRLALPPLQQWQGQQVVRLLQGLLRLRTPHAQLLAACAGVVEGRLAALRQAGTHHTSRTARSPDPPSVAGDTVEDNGQLQPVQITEGLQPPSSYQESNSYADGWSLGEALQCVVTLHHLGAAPASLVAVAGAATLEASEHEQQCLAPDLSVALATAAVAAVLQQQGRGTQQLEGQPSVGADPPQAAVSPDMLGRLLGLVRQQQQWWRRRQQQQRRPDGAEQEVVVRHLPAAPQAKHTLSMDDLALMQAVYALQQMAPGMVAVEDTPPTTTTTSSSSSRSGTLRDRQRTGGMQQPAEPLWALGVALETVEDSLAYLAAAAVRTHGGELSDLAAAVQTLPGSEGGSVDVCWTPGSSPLLLPVALALSSSSSSTDINHQSSDRISQQDQSPEQEALEPSQGVAFCLVAAGGFTQSQPKQPLGALRLQQLVLECCGWRVVWVPLETWQQVQQVPVAGRPRRRWQLLVECLREAGLWDTRTGRLVVGAGAMPAEAPVAAHQG